MAGENQQLVPEEHNREVSPESQASQAGTDKADEVASNTAETHQGAVEHNKPAADAAKSGKPSKGDSVGDAEMYKILVEAARKGADSADLKALLSAAAARCEFSEAGANQPLSAAIRYRRFSRLQKILVFSIVAMGGVLIFAMLKSVTGPAANFASTPQARQIPLSEQPRSEVPHYQQQVEAPQVEQTQPTPPSPQAVSLRVAETLYQQKSYDQAYAVYNELCQHLGSRQEQDLRDFLQLKMALCVTKQGRTDEGARLLKAVSQSRSAVVGMLAHYYLSLIETDKKQYLTARTSAYRALALVGAADFDREWAAAVQRDCQFLIAESATRNVLFLCDADRDLPADFWNIEPSVWEPWAGADEGQLRALLKSGSNRLGEALLQPKIEKMRPSGKTEGSELLRWSVVSYRAPIGELLARFSAHANIDVRWHCGSEPGSDTGVRKRPVNLCVSGATAQQILATAAGCAGLLAQFDDKGTAEIYEPAEYSALSDHIELLGREAVLLLQRFLIAFPGDNRAAKTHFALGLVQSQRDQIAEAIAEYKLVANKYSQTSLAPAALLCSGRLKNSLLDYSGAREDLKKLVEQYPDSELFGQACLQLADTTAKAGLADQAERLYCKLYNLAPSVELQIAAALGAGRCFWDKGDYENAAKWLKRNIELARERPNAELFSAYYLLGRTYLALGKPEQACEALRFALAGQMPKEDSLETIGALVEANLQQKLFVEALSVLESVNSWQLSQRELAEIILWKARVLRAMGVVDKAIAALGDRVDYAPDEQLLVRMSFELAKCHIAKGNLELANRYLGKILATAESGALAHEIALELAAVCLKLGQNSQAISVCTRLLDSQPLPALKQKALNILATAHREQNDYDRAALALAGQWGAAGSPSGTARPSGPERAPKTTD